MAAIRTALPAFSTTSNPRVTDGALVGTVPPVTSNAIRIRSTQICSRRATDRSQRVGPCRSNAGENPVMLAGNHVSHDGSDRGSEHHGLGVTRDQGYSVLARVCLRSRTRRPAKWRPDHFSAQARGRTCANPATATHSPVHPCRRIVTPVRPSLTTGRKKFVREGRHSEQRVSGRLARAGIGCHLRARTKLSECDRNSLWCLLARLEPDLPHAGCRSACCGSCSRCS
jgi:hypothetical protein